MASKFTASPAALATGVILVGAAAWLGGWPWAFLTLAVTVEIRAGGEGAKEEWLTVFPALLWTALSAATGDRRLMFPFALQLAAGAACRRGLVPGAAVVALFAAIRWIQDATAHVLGVEMIAAVPALAAGVWVRRWSPEGAEGRFLAGVAAAVIALLGLLL